jgi:hypothetical protein
MADEITGSEDRAFDPNIDVLARGRVNPSVTETTGSIPINPAPTVLSSKPAREKTIDNRAKLSDFGESLAEAQKTADKIRAGLKDFSAEAPKDETPLDAGETTTNETDDGFDDTRAELEQGNIDIDAELVEIESMLNLRAETLDTANTALINSIKQTYERRRNELRKVNEATLAGLTTLGIRAGRQRYAGEIQSGILSSEERAGIQRITELDNEELALIAQANAANDEKQFALLETKMNKLQEARREKLDLIRDMNTLALQEETNARDRIRFNMEADEFDRNRSADIADTITSSVLSDLTGDSVIDDAMFQSIADSKDIDVDTLRSSVLELQTELASVNGQLVTSTDAAGNVTVSLVDKDTGKLIEQTGLGAVGKPQSSSGDNIYDPRAIALENKLMSSRDANGYVPLSIYESEKRTSYLSASQFDAKFGSFLNDTDRVSTGADKEQVAELYLNADQIQQLAANYVSSRGLEDAIAEIQSTKSFHNNVADEGEEPEYKPVNLTDSQVAELIAAMRAIPTDGSADKDESISKIRQWAIDAQDQMWKPLGK